MLAYNSQAEWLEQRKKGIGGSDSPVIVLPDYPYKTPYDLYLEKRGQGAEVKVNSAMERGIRLEPVIAEIFEEKTGLKTSKVSQILQHPKHPWMLGNLDREVLEDSGKKGVLEIKCPGLRQFAKIKREGVLDYYMIQLQHYLQMGYSFGYFAIFNSELWELINFRVSIDQELGNIIIEKDGEFWNLVINGIPPEQREKKYEKIEIPKIEGTVKRIESGAFRDAIKEYMEAKALLDEINELKESAENRIKNLMEAEGADIAETTGFRAYYKEQAGRTTFDSKSFKKHNPEIDFSGYEKTGKPSRPLKIYKIKEEEDNGSYVA